jgi:hypothetical protein
VPGIHPGEVGVGDWGVGLGFHRVLLDSEYCRYTPPRARWGGTIAAKWGRTRRNRPKRVRSA